MSTNIWTTSTFFLVRIADAPCAGHYCGLYPWLRTLGGPLQAPT